MNIEQGWKAILCSYLSGPEIFVMVSSLASTTSCLISDASIDCFLGKKGTCDGKLAFLLHLASLGGTL